MKKSKNLLYDITEEELYILQRALVEFICRFGYPENPNVKYTSEELKTAENLLNNIVLLRKN